jgi:hypothetical protein
LQLVPFVLKHLSANLKERLANVFVLLPFVSRNFKTIPADDSFLEIFLCKIRVIDYGFKRIMQFV